MEESVERSCDLSWFQISANCLTFLQDSRSGRNWCADTKEANRVEQRQQLLLKTSRVPSWNSILSCARTRFKAKFRPTLKPAAEMQRAALRIRWIRTALVKEARRAARQGKSDGKNGKKEGKGQNQSQNPNPSKDVVCWHCGKKDHWSTECWSNPKNQAGSGGIQNRGGKGKSKNGTGKGPDSLEQGDQTAASSPDLASFETPGRSPRLDPEGWLTWTCDFGGVISALPLGAKIGTETQANDCSCKTDCGKLISDHGGLCVQGTTEYGYGVTFHGRKADVHTTLISASKVHSKGHIAVVDSKGGYIIP